MKAIFNLLFLLSTTTSLIAQSPSEKYLLQITEDQIADKLLHDGADPSQLNQIIDLFHRAIAQENNDFIGYHATTLNHFIFQEFVRLGFEEIYKCEVPEDFYFLRAPQDCFNIDGSSFLYQHFGRPHFDIEELRQIVIALIDHPIHFLSSCHLEWGSVSDPQMERIYSLLLTRALFLPNKAISRENAQKELQVMLEDLIRSDCDSEVRNTLQQAITLFVDDPFADDFRKLYPSWLPYEAIVFPFDETGELQKFVLSLNIPLYGNFGISSESTVHIFCHNESVELTEQDGYFRDEAKAFLAQLNISSEAIDEVYTWAQEHMQTLHGVLLQFFLEPTQCPVDSNRFLYLSNFMNDLNFDIPYRAVIENDIGSWISLFPNDHPILHHKQLRLVLSNYFSLNPWSGLKIKAYDLIDPEIKEELRNRIKSIIPRQETASSHQEQNHNPMTIN